MFTSSPTHFHQLNTYRHQLIALSISTLLTATLSGTVALASELKPVSLITPLTDSLPTAALSPYQQTTPPLLTPDKPPVHAPATSASQSPATSNTPVANLYFEANRGQSDKAVRYLARTAGYTAFLTNTGLVIQPVASTLIGDSDNSIHNTNNSGSKLTAPNPITLVSIGKTVNHSPVVEHQQPLASSSNYYLGNDPDQWINNVPHASRILYRDIYPGIDLAYYGHGQQLEYDYIVKPFANPDTITVAMSGVSKLQLQNNGDLALTLSNGETLTQQAPLIYQNGPDGREMINGHYVLASAEEFAEQRLEQLPGQHVVEKTSDVVRFAIDDYDHSKELIIDPVLGYSTYLGGSDTEFGLDVTTGPDGSVYVTGFTGSPDFPTQAGTVAPRGDEDAYVSKFAADGSLLWSTLIGGSDFDISYGIDLDVNIGSVWITGETSSTNFPTNFTYQTYQSSNAGGNDAFVARLYTGSGNVSYSTYLGGTSNEHGSDIISSAGDAWIIGSTSSTDFPTLTGAYQTTLGGGADAFVTRIGFLGGVSTSTYLGGSGSDYGAGIARADTGSVVWVTGGTSSTDFPLSQPYQSTYAGGFSDVFVTQFNPSGNLVTSTYLGGSGYDGSGVDHPGGLGIAVDSNGAAWVTGKTISDDFPLRSPMQATYSGGDAYVSQINPSGDLVTSTYLGGSGNDAGHDITVDNNDAVWVTGVSGSTDFPLLSPTQSAAGGGNDTFVTQLNNSGSLAFSTYLGGSGNDVGLGVAVGDNGIPWVTGHTQSNDFPTQQPFQATLAGNYDAFLASFEPLLPSQVILLEPRRPIGASTTPTFLWKPAAGATWYYLWVDGPGGNVHKTWYAAASAGCSSGVGSCSATPATALEASSDHVWWIRAWNSNGFGPWSAAAHFTTFSDGPPTTATLISPDGTTSNNNPTYTWNAVVGSTWYYLWVNDANGGAFRTWYTAAQAGCSSGTGTCNITPPTSVSGNSTWWVQTWLTDHHGPWSSSMSFTAPP